MEHKLYELLAKANVMRQESENIRAGIAKTSDKWMAQLTLAAEKAPSQAEKGAIFEQRELLP